MHKRTLLTVLSLVALAAVVAATATAATDGKKNASKKANSPVQVQVFAPRSGDVAGKQSKGFLVDLALRYPSPAASGADFQLTGPTTHQNQAPFPGTFSAGVDEKVPGLIVLLSTTTVGAKNAQNLAGLFNLTGFTNQKTNEIWDTWIVGAPSFGKNVRSVLRVAVAADKNTTESPRTSPSCPSRSATDLHHRLPAQARRSPRRWLEPAPRLSAAQETSTSIGSTTRTRRER